MADEDLPASIRAMVGTRVRVRTDMFPPKSLPPTWETNPATVVGFRKDEELTRANGMNISVWRADILLDAVPQSLNTNEISHWGDLTYRGLVLPVALDNYS